MAVEKNGQEWVQPVVAGISLTSGVISLAVFALGVVPGGLASALVAAVGLALAATGLIALRRGRILKHNLRKSERFAAWAFVGLCVLTAVVVGVRSMAGVLAVPVAKAATGAELDQPYPENLVTGAYGGSFNMHKGSSDSTGGISVRYYVVSDPYFLRTLFTRQAGGYDRASLLDPANDSGYSGDTSDKSLIATLLDPTGSGVVSNEPLKYARFLYQKYIETRRPVGKLTEGVSSLQGKVGFDKRYKRDTITEDEDVVWFSADNATLLKDGWLDLDPLSREIVKANPKLTEPIAKAGGLKYKPGIQCGGEDPDPNTYEYAFLVPRKIQLVFLDVENTSDEPVEKVSIGYSNAAIDTAGMYTIWDDAKLATALKSGSTAVYSVPGGLDPGEHTLLPVGVRVGQYDTSEDYDPNAGNDLGYMGPIAGELTLDTGSGAAPVRTFDPKNLTFINVGFEGGSCPQVGTWSEASRRWVIERHVIVGANTPARQKTESWALQRFDGRAMLLERDHETSFLNEFVIQAIDETGHPVTLLPDDPNLSARDGRSLVMHWGDSRVVTFAGWRPGMRDARMIVTGWYQPDKTVEERAR